MRRNTQRLYESIMKVVDRSVRKALNEQQGTRKRHPHKISKQSRKELLTSNQYPALTDIQKRGILDYIEGEILDYYKEYYKYRDEDPNEYDIDDFYVNDKMNSMTFNFDNTWYDIRDISNEIPENRIINMDPKVKKYKSFYDWFDSLSVSQQRDMVSFTNACIDKCF